MSDRVALEVDGHTLVITMTRHNQRNAIDAKMTATLDAAPNRLDDEPELRVGIIDGGPLKRH